MEKEEIWKDVLNYEGLYEISNLGRVKSMNYNRTKKEKLLKPGSGEGGYLQVSLFKNKISKTRRIHQLVAEAFLNHTPCGYGLVVNHINFIRDDNRVENLEVVTARENINHSQVPFSSQYDGVCWSNYHKKWLSQIFVNGKNKNLGYFITEEEARKYYEDALKAIKNGIEIKLKRRVKSSEYLGVSWNNRSNKWQVNITIDKKRNYVGMFNSELEAHEAYVKASLIHP